MIRLALIACVMIALGSAAIAQIGMAPFQPMILVGEASHGHPPGVQFYAFAGYYGSGAIAPSTQLESGVPTGGYLDE